MLNQNSLRNLYKLYFIQRPPKTVEEFLKSQNWDYWPRDFIFPNKDQWLNDLQQLKHDCTVAEIYSHLWSTVPRVYDASMNMDTRLAECLAFMKKHASKLFEEENLITRTFLGCKSSIKKHKKKEKIMLSSEMKTEKNIEGFNFAGFKASELTSLPRHLDAERIYLFILKAQKLDVKVFKIWKSHFLLPSSIALLIDSFWWWFLYKFKPDKENQAFLFDRMSESYVMLFMSIPVNQKDAFIQVYPDYLSQAIYVTFQKAFPESCELFDEAFTKELVNTVFLWLSGLKPQKHIFAHWKWNDLCTSTTQDLKKETSKLLLEKITRTQELTSSSIHANIKILEDPKAHTMFALQDKETVSRHTTKSHPVGLGPELNHFVLKTGVQSPLIQYYLKTHDIVGTSKVLQKNKITLSEIYKEPPPFPTYRDVVKEAKEQFTRNLEDLNLVKLEIDEDIKFLKQRQREINKTLYRLQEKALKEPYKTLAEFEDFLYSLCPTAYIESKLDIFASLSPSSSIIEDYNLEELQKKSRLNN